MLKERIHDGKALKSRPKLWKRINNAVSYFNRYLREKVLEMHYTMVNRFLTVLTDNCGKEILCLFVSLEVIHVFFRCDKNASQNFVKNFRQLSL